MMVNDRRRQGLEPLDGAELLTQVEAARYLGVSKQTLLRWRGQKYGPAHYRVGPRLVMYRRADLEAWLREHKNG